MMDIQAQVQGGIIMFLFVSFLLLSLTCLLIKATIFFIADRASSNWGGEHEPDEEYEQDEE